MARLPKSVLLCCVLMVGLVTNERIAEAKPASSLIKYSLISLGAIYSVTLIMNLPVAFERSIQYEPHLFALGFVPLTSGFSHAAIFLGPCLSSQNCTFQGMGIATIVMGVGQVVATSLLLIGLHKEFVEKKRWKRSMRPKQRREPKGSVLHRTW